MAHFELSTVCNTLLDELNLAIGKKNIIKLGMDVQLPNQYQGSPELLTRTLKELITLQADSLVNGIIQIEINAISHQQSSITLVVKLTGLGDHRLTDGIRNRLVLLKKNSKVGFDYTIGDKEMGFEFRSSLSPVSTSQGSDLPFAGKNILVAEDNEINAMVFSSFLEEWGCSHTIGVNGAEAVSLALKNEFHAILMDIYMPILDGYQAITKIREFNPSIPIIALTASTNEDDLRKAIATGANDYLLKPVSSAQLFQVLSKYI